MKTLCRLASMILLFLLLANCPFADGAVRTQAAVAGRGSEVDEVALRGPDETRLHQNDVLSQRRKTPSYSKYSSSSPPRPTTPLEPALARLLTTTQSEDTIRVIAYLRQEADLGLRSMGEAMDESAARAALISRLQATANRAQAPIRAYLADEETAGRVSSQRPFWVTNAIAAEGRPSVVRALAEHPAVAFVALDHWRQWVDVDARAPTAPGTGGGTDAGADRSVEWNISRVRADEVWQTLGISGTGSVVAGMDTGVDWLHPALQRAYRGYRPQGLTDHRYSWFDATPGGALYPVDGHGHGSHTLGTIVGQGGIGVAPGARWIGVKVLNNDGYGYDSWIHAGFEWVLAPDGDPNRAPDVVNCSWGSSNPHSRVFQDDLRALRAAGIVPVFSSGNEGPRDRTVSSPASLPEALAVGAVDRHDEVASFSGRGPSPWGEIRPQVAAPGVRVRSSTPGGTYMEMDGTSMAAPHVAGVTALLRSVSPTLSITRVTYVMTSTAVSVGEEVPNNDTGWGRLDAFAAVRTAAETGLITGTVRHAVGPEPEDWRPIAGASVRATSHGGQGGMDTTDVAGEYTLALAPGSYDLTVSAFGYASRTVSGVRVMTDTTTRQDVSLTPVPTGTLEVEVVDAGAGDPVTATMEVLETPYRAVGSAGEFHLPSGSYVVRVESLGYYVATEPITISVGETTEIAVALVRAPSILLVDSGGWYYRSRVTYFREALDDLRYAYDEWSVRDRTTDVPSPSDLAPYDVVIWSAPRDAPGHIGAGGAVGEYLEEGGRLLLTGQDVGFWDGGGNAYEWSPYYHHYLKARFVADDAPTRVLEGSRGDIFSGQTITIAGPGGADNQDYPDVISVVDPDAAAPVLSYKGDGCGGAQIGTCLDYRAVYLAFGFEAITDAGARREVMKRSLDWLTAPAPTAGLELRPQSQMGIDIPGSVVTHTVRVRHIGQGGSEDVVDLELEGVSWDAEISDRSLTLSPCVSRTVTITVTIPPTATADVRNVVTLTARSSLSPTLAVRATLETKTPAPVLLVDDDRWYDQQASYAEAMAGAQLTYDVWETSRAGGVHRAGPSAETLQWYPVVVWWTGYDWYAPVTPDEQRSLETYLGAGGRLMLSSQDYLYYHHDESFARDQLGVLTYTEDITPTEVVGVLGDPVGEDLGPWTLTFPTGYQNWSDGVVPARDVSSAFREGGPQGAGAALGRRGDGDATLFLPFPFEALPEERRALAMERSVGWLSWLGESEMTVAPRAATTGDTVTYTLTMENDGPASITASLSNTVPADLEVHPETLQGPASYDAAEGSVSWEGEMASGEIVTVTYRATVLADGSDGGAVDNPARVRLMDHHISFDRTARMRIDAPDLSGSAFGCSPWQVRPGRRSTCTVSLRNGGVAEAEEVTAYVYAPGAFETVEGSLEASHGAIEERGESIVWSGPLGAGTTADLTFQIRVPDEPVPCTLYGVAFVDDGTGEIWERPTWLRIDPWTAYLPVVGRP